VTTLQELKKEQQCILLTGSGAHIRFPGGSDESALTTQVERDA